MPINSQQGQSVSERLVEANWNDVGNNTGGLASPTTLQRAPGIEDNNTEVNTVLPDYGVSEQGVENRAGVVDNNAQQVERPPIPPLTPDLVIETDASLLGWGAATEQMSTGSLWSEEERTHHINLLELAGGALTVKTFTKGRKNIQVLLRMDNTTAIAYINRHKVSDPIPDSLRSLALVPPAGDNPVSSTPAGHAELHSGRRVQDTTVVSGVDAGEVNLSHCHTDPGLMLSGPLCHSPQQPPGEVNQLAPRPVCDGNRCLYYVVTGGGRVCISPILRDRQMPTECSPGGVYSGSGDKYVH